MGRYDGVPSATLHVASDGTRREVRYLRRRMAPPPGSVPAIAEHVVVPDDRLDLLSFRLLGDPFGFWRICDANAALDPDDLVDETAVGDVLQIPQPGAAP